MKDAIIVMPMGLPWRWSTDYYEQTARILAKKNYVFCVQCDSIQTLKTIIRSRKFPSVLKKIHKRLYIYEPIDLIPFRRLATISAWNRWILSQSTKVLLRLLGWKSLNCEQIIWIFDPQFFSLARLMGNEYKEVYDIVDYVGGAQIGTLYKDQLMELERHLLNHADFVTTNSYTLFQYYKNVRPDVVLVPQGFRLEIFQKSTPLPKNIHIPHDKPVIGYVGGINYRLDFELLMSLVRHNPQYYFVFAGQMQTNDAEEYRNIVFPKTHRLFSFSNCYYIGNVLKRHVPSVINQFDICMIPYNARMDFNKYSYPMKLMEYFYFGKPVISTPIQELNRYKNIIRIGNSTTSWERHIKEFLQKPISRRTQRIERTTAQANSWERKVNRIVQLIESS